MQPRADAEDQLLGVLLGAGHLARGMRRHACARHLFDSLRLAYPERASPWLGLALLEIDSQDPALAARHCRAALQRAPDHALAQAWLGVCHLMLGDGVTASYWLRRARNAGSPTARQLAEAMLGLIAFAEGNADAAVLLAEVAP
ncbi:MAG TPA: tetratricopeptide repeat protein [Stenotrophomonas sp.]|nr:tetratricopeptide repeat protein [Stenotrophomonas sp.]